MEFFLQLAAERSVVRESIKGVIWTIFFHRLFGPITPVTNEFLNTTYPMAANLPDLDSLIDEKISRLIRQFDSVNAKTGRIVIKFLDKNKSKSKKKTGWFAKADSPEDEVKVWEVWILTVTCIPLEEPRDSNTSNSSNSNNSNSNNNNTSNNTIEISIRSFDENLNKIIDIADTHKDHIPPIMTLDSSPFPYVIEVGQPTSKEGEEHDESWGEYIKKMSTRFNEI
ncbi:predicted protein [Scheffersomyces stipitis CBS 6054]|uniref:Autophagy-related protein 101 n=1 Tax=Scheffersomyces stipitis (strain ATCC 58785 / CBS 6054 / NBRC 10063 / NRRL Y-11545) TaxID=322104 RepID=A3LPP2_PICST|nr:predicted protein [Scheffersomyces stipitis CBS 6054]ABN64532.2 predicted protein [Scheffersomyces stipitis CBS 6054]